MTSADVCLKIESKKKVKSVNFTPGEIDLLLTLNEENKDKLRSSKTSPEVKGMIWDRIAEQLSVLGVCIRTGINVKNKRDNLQRHGKMEEAIRKAHKKGTGGGEGLPVKEKKEEALHQRVVNLCADDLSFCGITGGYQTKICLGPAPTKSELLNVNIVSSGSSYEVDDVKSKDSEQVNKKQCSSSQSSKKRKSISEELQDAQLNYFKEQTEKVKLQKLLIIEEVATSKAKRRFFERVTKNLEQKEASSFLQILSDE